MTTQRTDSSPTPPDGRYVFSGSSAAEQIFANRTAHDDARFLLSHLRPGMRVVDCGCGTGSITVGLAQVVAPGEVVGLDLSETAIAEARARAAKAGVTNVQLSVGSVYDTGLPSESFDAALFSGVLAHLADPARALQEAFRLLKPGGLLGAREPQKGGDWFAGPFQEAMEQLNVLLIEDWRLAGGDPLLGRRLPPLLRDAGFTEVELSTGYSATLSNPQVSGEFATRHLREPAYTARLVSRGLARPERLERMVEELTIWMESPDAIIALAECTALARKP